MPRARSRRSSRAAGSPPSEADRASPSSSPCRAPRPVRASRGASPANATSCCWAPSSMLRSSLRRSSSCAVTSLLPRDARSSFDQPHAPKDQAAPGTPDRRPGAPSSAFIGSEAGIVTESAPKTARRGPGSPRRGPPRAGGCGSPSSATDGRSAASVGQDARRARSSVPTRSHTVARSAPIPLPSTCAMARQHVVGRVRLADATGRTW